MKNESYYKIFKIKFCIFITSVLLFYSLISCSLIFNESDKKSLSHNENEYYIGPVKFNVLSYNLRKDGDDKNGKLYFNRDVTFKFKNAVLKSDNLIISYRDGKRYLSFDFDGSVEMVNQAKIIKSQKAFTDNINQYINFSKDVVIKDKESEYHTEFYKHVIK